MRPLIACVRILTLGVVCASAAVAADMTPLVTCTIPTKWAKELTPEKVLPDYPRPQLVRKDWLNLNGSWDYAVTELAAKKATAWQGRILVPFCMESLLSGVAKSFTPEQRLWYHRTVTIPPGWAGKRVRINFGAVDYETEVFVNDASVGTHLGGYDPFSFDITDQLKAGAVQELVVKVADSTDRGRQPVGKQTLKQEGFWYTPVSGIWQTVWLEPVAKAAVTDLKMVPDLGGQCLRLTIAASDSATTVIATAFDGRTQVATVTGKAGTELSLALASPKLWSPDSPFLYDLTVTVKQGDQITDTVTSYFGMRSMGIGTANGFKAILLNGRPIIQVGLLDQGWWPDGLYTAPTDEALKFDIQAQKDLGYNMIRKHIKVEPARWYFWADRIGMLVWQDMPSRVGKIDPTCNAQFERELDRMVVGLGNQPSISTWIDFNEGCGSYDAVRIANHVKELDPSRLVTIDSGWFDSPAGDINDIHNYPTPSYPAPTAKPRVLGEHGCGALVTRNHVWKPRDGWIDGPLTDGTALLELYREFADTTRSFMMTKGLVGMVYTQITDVENELNGLYTYDRSVLKVDAAKMRAINEQLRNPGASWFYTEAVETSERFGSGMPWLSITTEPAAGWYAAGFDDTAWTKGNGAFGDRNDRAHTKWENGDVWFRKVFTIENPVKPEDFRLRTKYAGEIEVFLNGVQAFAAKGQNFMYRTVPISVEAAKTITPGRKNCIAVHARKTGGGPYADAGLLIVTQPKPAP